LQHFLKAQVLNLTSLLTCQNCVRMQFYYQCPYRLDVCDPLFETSGHV
jgi:hypothetical protein